MKKHIVGALTGAAVMGAGIALTQIIEPGSSGPIVVLKVLGFLGLTVGGFTITFFNGTWLIDEWTGDWNPYI